MTKYLSFLELADDTMKKEMEEHVINFKNIITCEVEKYFSHYDYRATKKFSVYRYMTHMFEEAIIEAVLEFTHGNEVQASKILGISRAMLRQRREKFGHYIEKK